LAKQGIHPKGQFAAGPYSHGIVSGGFLFLSGKMGTDSAGKLVGPGIAEQTRATFANLKDVLDAAGLSFDHVVKCNVYLTDMSDFAAMNTVYGDHFKDPRPARTTVAVAALPLAGGKVEIEMVAENK
jgi:2-iminobutanoate/2-iminopropanoate deaminase